MVNPKFNAPHLCLVLAYPCTQLFTDIYMYSEDEANMYGGHKKDIF